VFFNVTSVKFWLYGAVNTIYSAIPQRNTFTWYFKLTGYWWVSFDSYDSCHV